MKVKNGPRNRSYRKRYVHVSITEVYVSCSGFVGEYFSFNPSTPYAVSRSAADMNLRNLRAAYDFPVVTTRAANVYGSWQQLYRTTPRTILFTFPGKKLQLNAGGLSIRACIHPCARCLRCNLQNYELWARRWYVSHLNQRSHLYSRLGSAHLQQAWC